MPRPFFLRTLCGRLGSIGNAESPYQQWADGYYQSPILTADYPYQLLVINGVYTYLRVSTGKFYVDGTSIRCIDAFSQWTSTSKGDWASRVDYAIGSSKGLYSGIIQANNDVYTSVALTTVYFAKSTP